ncbi:hypothetical protein Fmac_005240 [Flemingia macrophylla]|uniref:Uncharacterized protein n=1 Tax=Flemingia macrophylla TaxID=520843 RepID=A0ABD1N9T7_9FABA
MSNTRTQTIPFSGTSQTISGHAPITESINHAPDLCMAKEGLANPRYKGFYTLDEANKALELDTIDPKIINQALNPEPEVVVINSGGQNPKPSYKDSMSQTLPDLDFKNFMHIQKFFLKLHQEPKNLPGLYIKVHPYFNPNIVCTKTTPLCSPTLDKNCPCNIKFLFRKAGIDLEQFKPQIYEDVPINIKTLLDYGCLDSIIIPPTERFTSFGPSINDAINQVQADLMSSLGILITTCPSSYKPNGYATHVMKVLPEDHKDFPVLYNDGFEKWDVQGNTTYQHNLLRAQWYIMVWPLVVVLDEVRPLCGVSTRLLRGDPLHMEFVIMNMVIKSRGMCTWIKKRRENRKSTPFAEANSQHDSPEMRKFFYCVSQYRSACVSNVTYTPQNPSFTTILNLHAQNKRFKTQATPKP